MKAVILAAGIGSRLKPITDYKPKALVKVCGKPILEYQIESYLKAGLKEKDIAIVIGYKGSKIKEFCSKKFPCINIVENKQFLVTNNMYSLYLYLKQVFFKQSSKNSLIISNGDCIYDSSIVCDITMIDENLVTCDISFFSNESMKVKATKNKKSTLIEISKEIPKEDVYAVSIDLYKFSYNAVQKLWTIIERYIERGGLNKWTEVAINDLMKVVNIKPFNINKRKWVEIDNLDDLLYAEKIFSRFDYRRKKVFVLDLDGTIYMGNKIFHRVIDFINKNWEKFQFYFMTNNTSRSRKTYLSKLQNIGLKNVRINNLLTPIYPLVEYLKKNDIKNVYCLCTKDFIQELQLEGIDCVHKMEKTKHIQAVIVGFDTELTYKKLEQASLLLRDSNIQFFLTHPDKVCPTEHGFIPDAGSIAALLENVTGRKPDKIFGKPFKGILLPLLKKYKPEEMAIVGDRLYTDKRLADNVAVDFILVLSGETRREDVERKKIFPAIILRSLEGLEEV